MKFRSQYWHEYAGARSAVEESLTMAFRFARVSMALLTRLSSHFAAPAWILPRHVERLAARHSQFAGWMEILLESLKESLCRFSVHYWSVCQYTVLRRFSSVDAHLTCRQHGRPNSMVHCSAWRECWLFHPQQELLCATPCRAIS